MTILLTITFVYGVIRLFTNTKLFTSQLTGIFNSIFGNWCKNDNYQILSFQEWCDLNNYKMKAKCEFEVGDYVIVARNTNGSCNEVGDIGIISEKPGALDVRVKVDGRRDYGNFSYLTEIRHATPEEINNHLISTGQIPAGEPLNTGIEPNKDGMFKYTTYAGTTYVGKISTISGPLKMTLSIDDEELPMVSIIKTNTIKQLLSND